MSPGLEWQTTIYQSACADETHHSSDCQFYLTVQNHFLFWLTLFIKGAIKYMGEGVKNVPTNPSTHGCRHTILRPCISGQSTHSLTLIQVITKSEILLTHRRNKADTKCTHTLFQPAPSHSTRPARGPQCAWGVQSCPAPCLCCREFPAEETSKQGWYGACMIPQVSRS